MLSRLCSVFLVFASTLLSSTWLTKDSISWGRASGCLELTFFFCIFFFRLEQILPQKNLTGKAGGRKVWRVRSRGGLLQNHFPDTFGPLQTWAHSGCDCIAQDLHKIKLAKMLARIREGAMECDLQLKGYWQLMPYRERGVSLLWHNRQRRTTN